MYSSRKVYIPLPISMAKQKAPLLTCLPSRAVIASLRSLVAHRGPSERRALRGWRALAQLGCPQRGGYPPMIAVSAAAASLAVALGCQRGRKNDRLEGEDGGGVARNISRNGKTPKDE